MGPGLSTGDDLNLKFTQVGLIRGVSLFIQNFMGLDGDLVGAIRKMIPVIFGAADGIGAVSSELEKFS